MRKNLRSGLTIFVFFSLFIHLSAWLTLRFTQSPRVLPKEETIEFVVLDQSLQNNKKLSQQIVEQNEKPINDEIPEDAKYLSANNQKVVKETRAKEVGEFRNSAGQGFSQQPVQEQIPQTAKAKAQKNKMNGNLPTLADLRPQFDPGSQNNTTQNSGQGGPASQSNDHLKDVDPSLETLLSTREFVYYTYYQRIRSQIRQYWEPSIRGKVKKIFAQGRSIASEKDHITRVIIILDNHGNLKRVQVVGESGVKDLDDAAVEAFRAAEPFPNPPKGIVDTDGLIKINWDFILEA